MFSQVSPDAVPGVWESIAPRIAHVLKRTREKWTARQVLIALLCEQATLFTHSDGFVILQRCEEDFSRDPYLNAWIAWFKPMAAKAIEPEFAEWMNQMQAKTNCTTWKLSSPRLGWRRALEKYCDVERVVYRRKQQ